MSIELCPCSELDWRDVDQTQPHHPDCHFKAVVFQSGGPECESTPGTPIDLRALSKLRGYKSISQEKLDELYVDFTKIVEAAGPGASAYEDENGNIVFEQPNTPKPIFEPPQGQTAKPTWWGVQSCESVVSVPDYKLDPDFAVTHIAETTQGASRYASIEIHCRNCRTSIGSPECEIQTIDGALVAEGYVVCPNCKWRYDFKLKGQLL